MWKMKNTSIGVFIRSDVRVISSVAYRVFGKKNRSNGRVRCPGPACRNPDETAAGEIIYRTPDGENI